MHKVYVLVNPHSGTRNAPTLWHSAIEPALSEQVDIVEVCQTERRGHAKDKTIDWSKQFELTATNTWGIVCLGGDGLVHEVLVGLAEALGSDFSRWNQSVWVCPLDAGSGNALSSALNRTCSEGSMEETMASHTSTTVPESLQRSLRRLLSKLSSEHHHYIDILSTTLDHQTILAHSVVSVGVHAHIVSNANLFRRIPFMNGKKFLYGFMKTMWEFPLLAVHWRLKAPKEISLGERETSGQPHYDITPVDDIEADRTLAYLLFSKISQLEPGFVICPCADTDGMVDVITAEFPPGTPSRSHIQAMMGAVWKQKHIGMENVKYQKVSGASIDFRSSSDQIVCVDGELYSTKAHLEIQVLSKALWVM